MDLAVWNTKSMLFFYGHSLSAIAIHVMLSCHVSRCYIKQDLANHDVGLKTYIDMLFIFNIGLLIE